MVDKTDYVANAKSDAKDMALNFLDQIVVNLLDDGTTSSDFNNDYSDGDSYHHENHVDKDYDLTESAELLEQLREYEETDSGLWEGCEPRKAIACQAAYTYGNAVASQWSELIDELNEDNDTMALYGLFTYLVDMDIEQQSIIMDMSLVVKGLMTERVKKLVGDF